MLQQKLIIPQRWVLPIAFIMLLIPLFIITYPLLQYSKGVIVYPQDEAYIRMAIARNLALHGTWALTGSEFGPASSSLLYPFVLAIFYKIFGIHPLLPFLINLFTAVAFILAVQRWMVKEGVSGIGQVITLFFVIFLTPLTILVVGGMEHMLQVLFAFIFIVRFCEWLQQDNSNLPWNIYVLGMLVTATRYEGLFLILVACILLLLRRRFLVFFLFGLVSFLPVLIFGIYSLQHDNYFLPTSIMIKAIPIPLNGEAIRKFFKEDIFTRLIYTYNTYGAIATARLLLVLPIVYWMFMRFLRKQGRYRNILLFCLSITVLHLAFASVALFFRYEAYLVACVIPVIGVLISKYGRELWPQRGVAARWVAVWTGVLLLYPFFSRGWVAHKDTATECFYSYEQGYQAGKFIHQFYNDQTVIIDDVGVCSYLSDGKKMDLIAGIGYTEIARSREGEYYRVEYADYLVKNERPALAIVQENKYSYSLVQHWTKVADWYTNKQVVLRDNHLAFYTLDSTLAPVLRKQLQTYEHSLPTGVRCTYP